MGSVANADVMLPDAVVPKRESSIERYSSSSVSTPDPGEAAAGGSENTAHEPTPAPKRKGGRKPVSPPACMPYDIKSLTGSHRSMRPLKNENRETARPRLHSANDELNISSNSRPPSSTMRRLSRTSNKATVRPQMNV